jgi:hypothetical protein
VHVPTLLPFQRANRDRLSRLLRPRLSPTGAKTPPASVVGHILTAASSTATLNAPMYVTINSVTGAMHRLPAELPKPSPQEPDR